MHSSKKIKYDRSDRGNEILPKSIQYKYELLERLRLVVKQILADTKLLKETRRVCTEEVVFIISRVMQLKNVLKNCPGVPDLISKDGLFEHTLTKMEKNPSVELLRQLLHYVFQVAIMCICANAKHLTKLDKKPDALTHIAHIIIAVQEAYPDLPALSIDNINNCKILNIIQEWPSDKLVFCSDISTA